MMNWKHLGWAAVASLGLLVAGCGEPPAAEPQSGVTPDMGNAAAAANGPSEAHGPGDGHDHGSETKAAEGAATTSGGAAGSGNTVVLTTSDGDIEIELDAAKSPVTVENFKKYVSKGHYNGTIFHRVMKDFMIQGGGMTESGSEKPTDAPIKLESQNGLHNTAGTIAMARTGDPNSATSQFFINVVDNTSKLDYPNPDGNGYAVFGKVVKGMETVEKIRNAPVSMSETGEQSKPDKPVVIKSATLK